MTFQMFTDWAAWAAWPVYAVALAHLWLLLPEQVTKPLADFYLSSHAAKLLGAMAAVAGFVVVLYTGIQIGEDLQDRKEERKARTEERMERLLNRLLVPAGGDIGKGYALAEMYRSDEIDIPSGLSCRQVGYWDTEADKCISAPVFSGANLKLDMEKTYRVLSGIDFSNTVFRHSSFKNMALVKFNFSESTFENVTFSGFTGAIFDGSTFKRVVLNSVVTSSSFAGVKWQSADVSWSMFGSENSLFDTPGAEIYAWADAVPRIASKVGTSFKYEPLSDATLSKVILCAPPLDNNGELVLRSARRDILDLMRNRTVGDNWNCEKMSPTTAKARFPESFAVWSGHATYWQRYQFAQ